MWRKNREPNFINGKKTNCIGTDLNRNYDYKFMSTGSSSDVIIFFCNICNENSYIFFLYSLALKHLPDYQHFQHQKHHYLQHIQDKIKSVYQLLLIYIHMAKIYFIHLVSKSIYKFNSVALLFNYSQKFSEIHFIAKKFTNQQVKKLRLQFVQFVVQHMKQVRQPI